MWMGKGARKATVQEQKQTDNVSWKLTCFSVERKKLKVKVRECD